MQKAAAVIVLSMMLVMGQKTMPVYAAASGYTDIDMKYPLGGGLAGGAGTLVVLISMSRTKRRATHADENINLENSIITYRDDQYIRTDKRKKNKK